MLVFPSTVPTSRESSFRPSAGAPTRFLGRCLVCRHGLRVAGLLGPFSGGAALQLPDGALIEVRHTNGRPWIVAECPSCQAKGRRSAIGQPICIVLAALRGVFKPDKRCGAACLNAAGPSCECACGGEHHGAAYDAP